ncbi:hypothetical protein ASPBRDRAFT_50169 [Aspergillus brasiliensis CBS 101740]|uniref:NACHT domain-containing protein n=1 Tax=Aspergillus brasiliensis (strain CBS 101740 / IMI 381727 / IBT 21946) TaxID=767769 RepID=A0A1L9UZX9_ASPBC|nr:hypothetical protein ASPBRDRAFT_50169 [Aspergillus brasiliensis CBS 101740]
MMTGIAYAAGAAAALAKEALMYMEPLYIKDRIPQRVEGTCQWLTNHHLFRSWREDHGSGLLWVSADPSSGKSVLAKYLVDEVLLSSETIVVCYYFFKDDTEEQTPLVSALCCILHQVFEQRPHLLSNRLRSSLWCILCELVKDLPAGQVICVLDALDECGCDEQSQLAECLTNLYQGTTASLRLRFLLTSRPHNTIQRRFQSLESTSPAIHLHGEGEHEVQKIEGEISMVIQHRAGELTERLQLLAEEQNLLLSGLTAVRNRTYLWITLIMNTLEDILTITPTSIRAAIRRLPRTLDEAYDKILCRTPDPDRAKRLLHIVLAAKTPLTVADMATAMAVLDKVSPEDRLDIEPVHRMHRSIRETCGLLATIIDSRIYLLRETARDFLVYKEGESEPVPGLTWKASLKPHHSEWILAEACIQRWRSKDQGDLMMEFNRTPFLEYSVKNWNKHVLPSGIEEDPSIHSQIMDILRRGEAFCLWFDRKAASIHQFIPSTTLMRASWLGLRLAVQTLLPDKDIKLDHRSTHGRSALSLAAVSTQIPWIMLGSHPLSMQQTLSMKTFRDADGQTPLAQASYHGHDEIVRLLLEYPAIDPNARDNYDRTPLAFACKADHENIVALLLETGKVDPNSEDHDDFTPFTHATESGNEHIIKLLLDASD